MNHDSELLHGHADVFHPKGECTSWLQIFHVPHDGNDFPEELIQSVCIPTESFMAYHEKMRDRNAGALIPPFYWKKISLLFLSAACSAMWSVLLGQRR